MKNLLFFVLFMLGLSSAFSQTYLEKIGSETCECLEKIPESKSQDEKNMALGLCMIESAMPYKKQLKKHNQIDLSDMGNEKTITELGTLVGLQMAATCPKALMVFAGEYSENEEDTNGDSSMMSGTVSKISNEYFVCFSIKSDENGKTEKYYWLEEIETDLDLKEEYKSLLDKNIRFSADTKTLFDPKINDYRQFNIITEIDGI